MASRTVIYLQDVFDDWLGARRGPGDPADHRPLCGASWGASAHSPRSTCPIADADGAELVERVKALDGIDACYEQGRRLPPIFELPEDRTGDMFVVSGGPSHTKVTGNVGQ